MLAVRAAATTLGLAIVLLTSSAHAAIAEAPITGGLGYEFNLPVAADALGAERDFSRVPYSAFAANRRETLPELVTPAAAVGHSLPWRQLNSATLPRLLREHESQTYALINAHGQPIRILSVISYDGCGRHFEWLRDTLRRKYEVDGSADVLVTQEHADRGVQQHLQITFSSLQIDVMCGRELVIDYANYGAITSWLIAQHKLADQDGRRANELTKRNLILTQRRAQRFADSFTLGDQFRLEGAFGIAFGEPFARNSDQSFPADEPFVAVLPNLPPALASGEIRVEISPERMPIVLRGTFPDLEFDAVIEALKAKYGTPFKGTKRHVIYNVSGNHAIVRRKNDAVELAFIDASQKAAQRRRLWLAESEGL